jgi:hypothetical protein
MHICISSLQSLILTCSHCSAIRVIKNTFKFCLQVVCRILKFPVIQAFGKKKLGWQLWQLSLHWEPSGNSRFSCELHNLSNADTHLTHWGRVTRICVFNTRLFSLHNTLNYAIHRACLRVVLLTDVYRNLTSLWINL